MQALRVDVPLMLLAWALPFASADAQERPVARTADQRIDALQQQVLELGQQLEVLRQQLADQSAAQQRGSLARGAALAEPAEQPLPQGPATAGAADVADDSTRAVRVGQAPAEDPAPPKVAQLFDQPGILTPKGRYVLEPSLQYGYSSSNRVALVGYTVIPALLIGLIDVREVKRHVMTAAVTGRWGLSNRLEAEVRVPYVYRSDATISREIFTGSASDKVFNTSGSAIGDVELGLRYQLNQPQGRDPYLIGSLRVKTRTGKDPFEVVTDCVTRCIGNTTGTGLPMELPTGSGFYSLQTGLTWLLPADPAVFFGSVSYTRNFGRSNVSRLVQGGQREFIGNIKPGDVVGVNFGMGLALNEQSTFSIGVDLNSVARTKQNGESVQGSVRTQLSSLLLGYSYRLSPTTTLNVTVAAGLTPDTPNLTLTVRVPVSF
jgi:hypothetical protein